MKATNKIIVKKELTLTDITLIQMSIISRISQCRKMLNIFYECEQYNLIEKYLAELTQLRHLKHSIFQLV